MTRALEDRRPLFFSIGFKKIIRLVLSNLSGALQEDSD